MIDPKRLLAMAKKWQRLVEKKQKRISFPRRNGKALRCSTVAKQGHFVVYTVDGERFELPLGYLRSNIFVELFRMSEAEFGLPRDGPISLPCESCMLEYVVSFVKGQYLAEDLEKAVLTSICNYVCHTSTSLLFHDLGQTHYYNQMLILGF